MCSMVIDGFDLRKCREMVCFGVDRSGSLFRGPSDSDTVCYEPFVDGLRGMCHEDPAFEVGLR